MEIPFSVNLLNRDRILPYLAIPLLVLQGLRLLMHWVLGDFFLVAFTGTAMVAFSIPLILYYLKERELAKHLFFAFLLIICTTGAVLLGKDYGVHSSIMAVAMLGVFLSSKPRDILLALLLCLGAYIFVQVSFLYGWQVYEPYPERMVLIATLTEIGSISFFVLLVYLYLRRELLDKIVNQQHTRALEAENQALQRLGYHITHDFSQSMHNIAQYSLLMEMKCRASEQPFDFLASDIRLIEKNAKHANDLIQKISIYLSVKQQAQQVEQIDLNEIMEEVRQSMEAAIEQKGATFLVLATLPMVHGIRFEWVFLFQNLLENALQYCIKENPLILVSAVQQGSEWVILFQDNGGAVDPALKERLFEPFFRLEQHKTQEGSGMGLFICKEIISGMNGTIRMESAPGEGTSFFLTIPSSSVIPL